MSGDGEVRAAGFQVASLQATIFTPDEEVSAAKLLTNLVPRWAGRYSGEPTTIPTAQGLPPEVPRLILVTEDGSQRCEIASARINLHWVRTRQEASPPSISEFYTDASQHLCEYREHLGARVGRMAGVVKRYHTVELPGLYLARHFCKERWLAAPLNRPQSFELHAHKRYNLPSGLGVNSWVRSRSGTAKEGEEDRPIVLVEQDLNTLPEEAASRNFSSNDIRTFFEAIGLEFDAILQLYYPTEDSHA